MNHCPSADRQVAAPPQAFDPAEDLIDRQSVLYRVCSTGRSPEEFNPGTDRATQAARSADTFPVGRFTFFLDDAADPQPVPVLYAATTENAALWETVLRGRSPANADPVPPGDYRGKGLARLVPARELHVASFAGADMHRFSLSQDELTVPGADAYPQTIPWVRAAWTAGYYGSPMSPGATARACAACSSIAPSGP